MQLTECPAACQVDMLSALGAPDILNCAAGLAYVPGTATAAGTGLQQTGSGHALQAFQVCKTSLRPTVALPLQQEKQQEAEERRQTMLASVLQPAARERRESLDHRPGLGCLRWPSLGDAGCCLCLHARADTCVCLDVKGLHGLPSCMLPHRASSNAVARIALVKPDKARGVENMVLQMAQRGQLTEKVRITHHKASNMPGTL